MFIDHPTCPGLVLMTQSNKTQWKVGLMALDKVGRCLGTLPMYLPAGLIAFLLQASQGLADSDLERIVTEAEIALGAGERVQQWVCTKSSVQPHQKGT